MADLYSGMDGAAGTVVNTANMATTIGADLVSLSGGTLTLATAAAGQGSTGLEIVNTNPAAAASLARWNFDAASGQVGFACFIGYRGVGSGGAVSPTARILQVVDTSGVMALQFRVAAAQQLIVADAVGGSIGSATPTFLPDVLYWATGVLDRAAGSASVDLYAANQTTLLGSWVKASGASLGANPFMAVDAGNLLANQAITVRTDSMQRGSGRTAKFGPYNTATLNMSAIMSGTGTPPSADTGVARTLTVTAAGGNGNPVSLDVDWGDGGAHDTSSMTAATPKVFTRTPDVAGDKTWTVTYTQA